MSNVNKQVYALAFAKVNESDFDCALRVKKELDQLECVIADLKIEINSRDKVLTEAMRLLKNGANGAITDTVWSEDTPNTTLYELMHNVTTGNDT